MPKNFKHFSPKNWKFLDGKSGLSKKIKVKMGLKNKRPGLMVLFCFREDCFFK